MSKEFKEGFSKGIGLTAGLLAIPAAGLLLFGVYRVLKLPVKSLLWSEEMYEYFDCVDKYWDRFDERNEARKNGLEVPPYLEACERPARQWKWQPKED